MRWRAFFYLNPNLQMKHKETYGFISRKTLHPHPPPPTHTHILQELKEFENNLADLIQNIKFKDVPNHFQIKLKKNRQKIKKDDHLYIKKAINNNFVFIHSRKIIVYHAEAFKCILSNILDQCQPLSIQDLLWIKCQQKINLQNHLPIFSNSIQ